MRKTAIFLVLVLGAAPPVLAEICALDTVPAATLLMPHFELDLSRLHLNASPEVQVSVRNVSPAPAIARVVFWTDMSVPTHAFNVYLTGYDVHTFDLSALFSNGIDGFADAHLGRASALLDGNCGGLDHGDQVVRGYLTIDAMNDETDLFPTDAGYFGPNGVASDENVLVGEYLVVDSKAKTLEAQPLVAIEASSSDARVTSDGNYTFYGRYVDWNATDHREPLPSEWSVRYQSHSLRTNTTLLVWRDSGVVSEPFACGAPEATGWYPLELAESVFFDEQENPIDAEPDLSVESQSRLLFRRDYQPPFDAGWVFLDFGSEGSDLQAFVETSQQYRKKRLRGRFPAFPMNNLCGASAPE